MIQPSLSEIYSGTYTPTYTPVANVDSITHLHASYIKVGDNVKVSIRVNIDPTAAAFTDFYITLPFATNHTGTTVKTHGSGTVIYLTTSVMQAFVYGESVDNARARVQFISTVTASSAMTIDFMYEIV